MTADSTDCMMPTELLSDAEERGGCEDSTNAGALGDHHCDNEPDHSGHSFGSDPDGQRDDEPPGPTTTTTTTTTNASSGDTPSRRTGFAHLVVFVVMPLLAMTCAAGAGYFRYVDQMAASTKAAQIEAVAAARDTATAMFSYTPATVEQSLNGARERLTGQFQEQFSSLINDVAIPGAKQYKVSTQVTIPAVAMVHADPKRVSVVLFVNQSATVGDAPPTDTAFAARATLEKVDDRWLIAAFDPI